MRSQRLALVALVLAVVVLVVHARVVLGGKTWDDVRYHTEVAPPRLAAAEAILAGEPPTWWEGSGLGVPLLGEPSHGAAYPLGWFAASPHALDLLALLHLFWLALGVALWARRLGASELASVVAGALIAASGIAMSTALRGALPALAHVPWVAWAALSLAAAETGAHARRAAAALGLLLGAIGLAGQLAILVDAVALAVLLGLRAGTRRWLAIGVSGGLAIAAAQWLPALAILGDGAGATAGALKPSRLIELVLPGSFGASSGDRAVSQIAGDAAQLPSLYIGAAVLALAMLARPSGRVLGLAAAWGALAFVVGRGGAGWPAWLGAPELHLAMLAVLAAAHAGVGVDAVLARQRRALLGLAAAAAITAFGLVAVMALQSRAPAPALDRALLDGVLAVACLVAAFAVAWRTRISAAFVNDAQPAALAWPTLAIAALVIAPNVGSLGVTAPVTSRELVAEPSAYVAAALASDATKSREPLRVYRPLSLYEEPGDITVADAFGTLIGTGGARFGLGAARSEDPARPAIHDRVWLAASSAGGALLDRYSIPLAILPGSMVGERRLVELAHRGEWALVRFPAPPAAAMVFEWLWAADDDAALARLFPAGTGTGLPTGVVLLHGTGPEQQDEPRAPEPCTVTRWARGAIDLTCAAQEPSYAVVSSTSARGWMLEVDGKATPWVTADVMRRAVALPPGAHVVSWRYEAPGLFIGFMIALAGALAMLALLTHALTQMPKRRRPMTRTDL